MSWRNAGSSPTGRATASLSRVESKTRPVGRHRRDNLSDDTLGLRVGLSPLGGSPAGDGPPPMGSLLWVEDDVEDSSHASTPSLGCFPAFGGNLGGRGVSSDAGRAGGAVP